MEKVTAERDAEIKKLNERIEELLVSSVEETQKRSQLQSRYDLLQKTYSDLQKGGSRESSPGLLSTSGIYDLLGETQEKADSLQAQVIELQKESSTVHLWLHVHSSCVLALKSCSATLLSPKSKTKKSPSRIRTCELPWIRFVATCIV